MKSCSGDAMITIFEGLKVQRILVLRVNPLPCQWRRAWTDFARSAILGDKQHSLHSN